MDFLGVAMATITVPPYVVHLAVCDSRAWERPFCQFTSAWRDISVVQSLSSTSWSKIDFQILSTED